MENFMNFIRFICVTGKCRIHVADIKNPCNVTTVDINISNGGQIKLNDSMSVNKQTYKNNFLNNGNVTPNNVLIGQANLGKSSRDFESIVAFVLIMCLYNSNNILLTSMEATPIEIPDYIKSSIYKTVYTMLQLPLTELAIFPMIDKKNIENMLVNFVKENPTLTISLGNLSEDMIVNKLKEFETTIKQIYEDWNTLNNSTNHSEYQIALDNWNNKYAKDTGQTFGIQK